MRVVKRSRTGRVWTLLAASVTVAALLLLLAAPGCGRRLAQGRMKVAASIVPLADFCRNVGGDRVEVRVMVPPGASPHTFEPTSGQMKFLSDARVLVVNGMSLESWATQVIGKIDNPGLVEVEAGRAVPKARLIMAVERSQTGGHDDRAAFDPHFWLDPGLAVYEVNAIRDGFIKADPAGKDVYRRNASDYVGMLEELDREIAAETSDFTRRKFVALHPAWTYFAERYGLEQVGVVEELPGKEPGASHIAGLISDIRTHDVKVVVAEPQLSSRAAEVIAREAGPGVVVVKLDPLGNPDNPEVDTYIKMMKHDVDVMRGAMR